MRSLRPRRHKSRSGSDRDDRAVPATRNARKASRARYGGSQELSTVDKPYRRYRPSSVMTWSPVSPIVGERYAWVAELRSLSTGGRSYKCLIKSGSGPVRRRDFGRATSGNADRPVSLPAARCRQMPLAAISCHGLWRGHPRRMRIIETLCRVTRHGYSHLSKPFAERHPSSASSRADSPALRIGWVVDSTGSPQS